MDKRKSTERVHMCFPDNPEVNRVVIDTCGGETIRNDNADGYSEVGDGENDESKVM